MKNDMKILHFLVQALQVLRRILFVFVKLDKSLKCCKATYSFKASWGILFEL